MNMNRVDFETALHGQFATAIKMGKSDIVINSGELHRLVGGYPGNNHRMPMCCSVMRAEMRVGDAIINQPPKGNGASLSIKYTLPR
jgi:5-methylcytosine-specific restriction protein A